MELNIYYNYDKIKITNIIYIVKKKKSWKFINFQDNLLLFRKTIIFKKILYFLKNHKL